LSEPTDRFGEASVQLLKFHGIYQQDDRDARRAAREGGGKAHSFMLRTKSPGGFLPARLYLAVDGLADTHGNGTIRITTRQGLQLHGVRKPDLKATVAEIAANLGSTLGACGDINRNVMASPYPFATPAYRIAREAAQTIADLLTPRTSAYYEIWQDGEVVHSTEPEPDPLYGTKYLPRKFKIVVAAPGDNSVDIYAHDLGIVPVLDAHGVLLGYDLTVGGGLGTTHGKKQTYPRLADEFAFVAPHQLLATVRAIVVVQRDWGDRTDRRHARLKYLVADRGLAWLREHVEAEAGFALGAWQPLPEWHVPEFLGWHAQGDGRWFYGLPIASGRVRDTGGVRLKSALRAIVERFTLDLQATPDQNLLLIGVPEGARAAIDALLAAHGVPLPHTFSLLERSALACPALPTCGLALAESERALPEILERVERELRALGLEDERIAIRVTGCPNGCARPYLGEIGLVGTSLDRYNLLLGGNPASTRLNTLYRPNVRLEELADVLRPLFEQFRSERHAGESFGDFCQRTQVEPEKALA
jgi:sulfite reductase (ferredoxin)